MRRVALTFLATLALAGPAVAQQQYAGKPQDDLRRCFDDSVVKLGEQKVDLGDFAVIAVGLCDGPITAYRDYVVAFEQRRGANGNGLQSRAEAALSTEFRRAKEAYIAYRKKGAEKQPPAGHREADV